MRKSNSTVSKPSHLCPRSLAAILKQRKKRFSGSTPNLQNEGRGWKRKKGQVIIHYSVPWVPVRQPVHRVFRTSSPLQVTTCTAAEDSTHTSACYYIRGTFQPTLQYVFRAWHLRDRDCHGASTAGGIENILMNSNSYVSTKRHLLGFEAKVSSYHELRNCN